MNETNQDLGITACLSDRRLLDHPFYRRWERGEVSLPELAEYAAQYRHFEAYLPAFLRQVVADLPEGPARELVAANLADELGDPIPHLELFERFACGVGAPIAPPSPGMSSLLATFEALLGQGPVPALAGFVAYESQAADVARTKAEGLRLHHGLDEAAVSFWQHHADVDGRHGAWAWNALGDLTDDPGALAPSARRVAEAWWAFLDERQSLAGVA